MALTGRIVASIYQKGVNPLGTSMGITESFPSANSYFYAAPPGITANGVTINSVIVLLPTGLKVNETQFYTDSTTTQLATNGS